MRAESVFFGLGNCANFGFDGHFPIAQFAGFVKVLRTHRFVFIFEDLAQFLVKFFSCGGQLGVDQAHSGTSFVYQVNCFVWEEAVGDVPVREFGCGFQGRVQDFQLVVLFVAFPQTEENLDRLVNGGFADHDGLEAPF